MNSIRNSSTFVVLLLSLLIITSSCKSKKKAMEAQAAAEKARIERENAEKEANERKQREAALKQQQEAEEAARKEADARRANEARASEPKTKLNQYFNTISNASAVNSANSSISEALSMFASGDTPVLIVISESGGQKDYDRPTTIKAYLNYLKDQKKNINAISDLKFDNNGKITEVELKKN